MRASMTLNNRAWSFQNDVKERVRQRRALLPILLYIFITVVLGVFLRRFSKDSQIFADPVHLGEPAADVATNEAEELKCSVCEIPRNSLRDRFSR